MLHVVLNDRDSPLAPHNVTTYLRVLLLAVHRQGVLAGVDEGGVDGEGLSPGGGVVEREPPVLQDNHAEHSADTYQVRSFLTLERNDTLKTLTILLCIILKTEYTLITLDTLETRKQQQEVRLQGVTPVRRSRQCQ